MQAHVGEYRDNKKSYGSQASVGLAPLFPHLIIRSNHYTG
jgi:hypothetical protein